MIDSYNKINFCNNLILQEIYLLFSKYILKLFLLEFVRYFIEYFLILYIYFNNYYHNILTLKSNREF